MNKRNEELTLKDIYELFKPKLWIMVLVSVILAAGAFVYSSFMKEDTYTSAAMVYIYDEQASSPNANELTTAKSMSETYRIIITNNTYLKHVINELPESYANSNISPSALKRMISVGAVDETQILRISVTSTDKTFAYDVAKTIVDIAPYRLAETIPNAMSITIVEYPELAASHNNKNAVRNTVVAFLAGFILMAVAFWVSSMFDVTVRDQQRLEATVDVPVLGVIPVHEVPVDADDVGVSSTDKEVGK